MLPSYPLLFQLYFSDVRAEGWYRPEFLLEVAMWCLAEIEGVDSSLTAKIVFGDVSSEDGRRGFGDLRSERRRVEGARGGSGEGRESRGFRDDVRLPFVYVRSWIIEVGGV